LAALIMVLCLAYLLGAQTRPVDGPLKLKLETIDQRNPCADLAASLAAGDRRFIAVRDFATDIPGVTEETYKKAITTANINVIEGTSDTAPIAAQDAAIEYAQIYNRMLVRWLRLEQARLQKEAQGSQRK
jgi:hypothetical protein